MKFLLSALLALPVFAFAENLVHDGSFELGGVDWTKLRYTTPRQEADCRYIAPVLDRSTKVDGAQSIRYDNPKGEPCILRTTDVAVTPGKPYTLSFYAKSSKPVKLRYLPISVIRKIVDGRPARDGAWFNPSRYVALSSEWTRHTFTFTPPEGHDSILLDFLWGEGNDATVWFDAIQIEPGEKATPYQPMREMEFTLDSSRHYRFDGDKPLTYSLKGVNYGKTAKTVEFTLADRNDYTGKTLGSRKVSLTVPAGGTAEKSFTVPDRPYGVYSVSGEYRDGNSTVPLMPYFYGIAGGFEPRAFDPDRDYVTGVEECFGFGFPNINGGKAFLTLFETDEAEFNRFFRNHGYSFLRIGNGTYRIFEWKTVEPEKGKFDFRLADRLVNQRIRQGYTLMGVLGNVLTTLYLPEWLLKRAEISKTMRIHRAKAVMPDLNDWREYVRAVVSHFKGRIRYWEILNEANLTNTPEQFVQLAKIAFEECRKIDPSIRVVSPNVTGDLGGDMGKFLEEFGRLGGYNYTDIVSFHPYASREERSPYPAPKAIRDIRKIVDKYRKGLPLWNTELYYLREVNSGEDGMTNSKVAARDFVRRSLLDLGENVRQDMLLHAQTAFRPDRNPKYGYDPFRTVRRLIPSDIYVAVNGFARLMDGAVSAGKLATPRGVSMYLYTLRDGTAAAGLWNSTPNRKFTVDFAEPETLEVFDVFGNPVAVSPKMPLGRDPYYIRGKKGMEVLRRALSASKILPEVGFELTRARWFAKNGKPALALEFRSTLEEQNLRIRPLSLPEGVKSAKTGAMKLRVPAERTAVLLIPVEAASRILPGGKLRLMIYDGKASQTLEVPVEEQRFIRSGECAALERVTAGKAAADDPFRVEFRVSATKEAFCLDIQIRDSVRGRFCVPDFWEGDCLEFYFDRSPLADIERREYRKDTFRLFLSAGAEGKPARLDVLGDVNPSNIRWTVTDTPSGWNAHLELPWSELRLPPGAPVSFDISADDNTGAARRLQKTWSGTLFNHRYRHNFGFWIPEK